MKFSVGHILELLDATILNPWLTGAGAALLYILLGYSGDVRLQEWYGNLAKLCGVGAIIRVNRALSRRALNNGSSATFDWNKEVVVVTGGAGGIGAKTVQKLASRGTRVVVIDVLPLTYPQSSNINYYKCDLTDFDAVQQTALRVREEVGNVSCVVANAGICRGKPILSATNRDIELTFGVNNLGLLWTAKAFLPDMVARNHGHFLIVASQTGFLTCAGVTDYSATKAAAVAIYEGLHTELKHTYKAPAVRMSVLSPSAVTTKMFDGIKADSNFVMPRLEAQDVADSICDILWSGRAQNLMIPAFSYIGTVARVLPEWLRVGMQDGGAQVMTDLNPHNPLN